MYTILMIMGMILIAAGAIVYVAIGFAGAGSITGAPEGIAHDTLLSILQWSIGGLLGGLGALLFIGGLRGLAKVSRHRKLAERLMKSGADAEGTVTFVDRNFAILVNQKPIYSIVEYTYRDWNGNEHTRRIENANSEIVIRKKIEVGSTISVKYAKEDPGTSIMVLV